MSTTFAIKTDAFEGPLELLLELIERRKLLINDISLAAVTDEYMEHVAEMQEHPVGQTAHFVLVASTLLLIKSKSLLPVLELTEEEEESIEQLEYRLKLYKLFKEEARELETIFGNTLLYERTYTQDTTPLFVTDKRTTTDNLLSSIEEIITKLPKKVFKKEVTAKKIISLEQMIEKLEGRIKKQIKVRFNDFSNEHSERGEVIVGFLAVLELVKQGMVLVKQEMHFSDIEIERGAIDTPSYS